jgi:hypothetical protein
MHASTLMLLEYFGYSHLPERLARVAKPLGDLAWQMAETLPESPEVTVGLRKLLEARDCFGRAARHGPPAAEEPTHG